MKYTFRFVLAIGGLLLLSLSVTMPLAAQENPLPAPTGPYPVGVTSLKLIDTTRKEVFTTEPDDPRAVTIWMWYPAEVAQDAKPSPYMNMGGVDVEKSDLAGLVGFFGGQYAEVLDWLKAQQRHAFENVPVAKGEAAFPVVLYFNILTGLPMNQSMQLEELASHGYIVIDVIYTFGYVPNLSTFPNLKVNGVAITYQAFETQAQEDLLFVLNQLDSLNANTPENPLAGRFNLDQIGAVGYSSGGWPTVQAANKDTRIKAGISQDGAEPNIRWTGSQPFMFMSGGVVDENLQRDYKNAKGPAFLFKGDELRHGSFSDIVLWPHPKDAGHIVGTIEGTRTVEIVRTYVLAFFDQYLKGIDQPLLQGHSPDYPEVTIESRNIK